MSTVIHICVGSGHPINISLHRSLNIASFTAQCLFKECADQDKVDRTPKSRAHERELRAQIAEQWINAVSGRIDQMLYLGIFSLITRFLIGRCGLKHVLGHDSEVKDCKRVPDKIMGSVNGPSTSTLRLL